MSAGSRQLKINIIGDAKSAEEAFASVEKSAGGMSEKLGTVGKVAGAAFVGIGAAAAGAFVVGAKGALDQEQALDKLQAQLGLTADEADEMGEVARNVFEGAWGDSVPGVLESIQTIRTALGDMSSEELQGLTEKFLTIEDLWAAPVEETARTVSTLTKNFKDLSEEQALDLITTGFQEGGDVGGELLDTLNEYAPAFSNIGLSADQFLGTLIAGSEAGAFSVDKVGDAMKEFEIRGQDASAATNEAFESMGLNAEEMGQAIASGGEAGERAFQASLAALAAMEDPVARNAAGVALFGSQWEDVGEDVVLAMAEGIEGIEGFEGATERAGDAAYDNLGTMWESFKRQAMGALTEAVTPAVLALAEGIGRIGKAFQEGGISGALEEVKEIGGEIWDSIAGLDWNGIAGTVIDGLTTGLSAAGDMTANIATWLWDAFKGINWQGIGETMVDGLMAGVSAVIDVGSRILTWLSDQLTSVDWSGLGMTVVDGLMAGIMAVIDAGERVLGWLSGQLSAVDWSSLGTTIVDGLMAGVTAVQDFGQRFVDWFRGGAESADWSGIGETISGQLSGALDTITDLGPVQSLIDMFNTHLLPVLQTVGDEIGNRVKPTIDGFRDSLGRVAENISTNLGPTLDNLRELWVQLQPAIGALLPILQTIATVVAGVLLAAFNGFVGLMSGVLPNAVNAAFAVLNGLIGIITGLVQTVTGVVQVIKGIFTGDWALAWKGAQNIVEGMVGAITSLFSGLWGALKGFIMAVVDGVIGLFQGLYNTVVGNSIIPDMINGIIEWFLKLPGELIAVVSGWVTDTLGFFSDLHADAVRIISDTVTSIIGFLADLVTDGATKAGEFVTGVIDKLIELFIDGPKRIYDFVVAGVEEIAKLAVRGAEEAGKLPGAVLDAIGDLGSTLLQTGKDLVSGLIQGIQESLPSLSDVAGGITSTITDGLGKLPGLSPSPLGIEIGQQFGDGLVVGMRNRMGDVHKAAQLITASLVDGMDSNGRASRETRKLSESMFRELTYIFATAPEIANEFIGDIVKGMTDGSIHVEDAMKLLAMIPQDELLPVLEEMSETYNRQIVQAIIDGNLGLVVSLKEAKAEIDAMAESMDTGAKVAAVYNENMKQLPDGSWVNVGGSSKAGSGGSSGGGQVTPSTRGGMVGEDNGYSFNHNTGMWTGPDGTTWKSPGWEQAQQNQTIQNTITVNVDGEPVAQSVNRVNTAALATNMGPV